MTTIEDTMRKFLFAATLLSGATTAYAQLPDAYIGAGVSQARIDNIFDSGRDFDLNNTAGRLSSVSGPFPFLALRPITWTWEANRTASGSMISTTAPMSTPMPSQPSQWASSPCRCPL